MNGNKMNGMNGCGCGNQMNRPNNSCGCGIKRIGRTMAVAIK